MCAIYGDVISRQHGGNCRRDAAVVACYYIGDGVPGVFRSMNVALLWLLAFR